MKLCALINGESGSTPGNAEEALLEELGKLGLTADILPASGGDIVLAVKEALDSKPDALIVWGGDGSVACALSASGPSGPPVLALPGGTMNLVHKRLHYGETDWKTIVAAAMQSPVSEPFAAGCVAEHQFFVAAMMGQVTLLAESREAVRQGHLFKAAEVAVQSDAMSVERRLRLESRHASGNQTFDAVAAAVVIGDGDVPRLEVAAIEPSSAYDWMAIAFDALMNGWRDAESIDMDETRNVLITDIDGREFSATIDGESVIMPSGTVISLKRHAANVLRARRA
ncbi:diacylglycerol kinase family protein [Hyphomonas sp.]|uniref:diacylglycerol/lipid kinase family protein n=1 Tax=Hyphomonas sp. TaxID=87 RepID=UPI0032EBC059